MTDDGDNCAIRPPRGRLRARLLLGFGRDRCFCQSAVSRQPRLALRRPAPKLRSDFIVSPSNADAVRAVDAWPGWHAGCLALVGAEGVGKSHLARAWAQAADAAILTPDQHPPPGETSSLIGHPILFEDADRTRADDLLFHLINMAGERGGGLLLTARTPPSAWPATLPDLRSRLNALPVAELSAPDDKVLDGVLRKFFGERSIVPSDDLIAYLVRRIERSVPVARDIVRRLDEAHGIDHRPVTRALARQILEIDDETRDLFE
jgi:chromosomal replication initiation ATPase DnaA